MVEGRTEKAFKPHLIAFLQQRTGGRPMPHLDFLPCHGRVHKGEKLRRTVEALLQRKPYSDAVIALTDVYTGTNDFSDAADAKRKMRAWVGSNDRFFPHAAQHDFEAWLLPYWSDIQIIAGHRKGPPPGSPESVNHNRPPSYYVKEIFEIGARRESYSKTRDAHRILTGKNLMDAADKCPELREFLNTILTLSGFQRI